MMIEKKDLANTVTMLRIFLTIPILALMYLNTPISLISASALFIVASISDWLDGYLARKYNSVSHFGQFMDPIADKVLVSGVLVLLLHLQKIDPLMVIILLTRDTLIGGIRSIAAADGLVISAKPTGKWKAALQMIALPAVIVDQEILEFNFRNIGYPLLWISVFLSVLSGWEYLKAYSQSSRR